MNLLKYGGIYHSAHFVLKIKLLLTLLSNFEIKGS